MDENALIIFLKYPEPGKVKTRLAKDIGAERAANIYKSLAEKIIRKTSHNSYKQHIFYTPFSKKEEIQKWLINSYRFYPQKGEDLGQKMFNAFLEVFNRGFRKAICIGTDVPHLTRKIIIEAFAKLEKNETVIGPSTDGGYYLIGMTKSMEEIFSNIDWGTDRVLSQTIDILKELDLNYSILDEIPDIDNIEDLRLYRKFI